MINAFFEKKINCKFVFVFCPFISASLALSLYNIIPQRSKSDAGQWELLSSRCLTDFRYEVKGIQLITRIID